MENCLFLIYRTFIRTTRKANVSKREEVFREILSILEVQGQPGPPELTTKLNEKGYDLNVEVVKGLLEELKERGYVSFLKTGFSGWIRIEIQPEGRSFLAFAE